MEQLAFIDFFAGIGGFRRGMELAGHKCVGFCEWDKFATASYTSMHLITPEQREYLSTLSLRQRQKEILKEEYRNGEWYASDIRTVTGTDLPKADCWCFGAPCQSFSVAGKRAGLEGESGLIREIFRLLDEHKEEDRPEWLIYENVKGMLSSNRGWDYAAILAEMDRLGYDIEWQNINSKWFVPQNRERIYTVGHLRRYGSRKVFPVTRTGGENSVYQLGQLYGTEKEANPSGGRVYDPSGIAPTTGAGHGMSQPQIGLSCFVDLTIGNGITLSENARTLCARYQKGMTNHKATTSGVAIKIIGEVNSSQDGQVHDISGISKCHSAGHNNSPKVAIPTKRDRGIFVEMAEGYTVYAVWYEKYQCYIAIRKLTPKEYFRLQGWSDDYFEKAACVNSDSQLYKQGGNGVTVPVVQAVAEKLEAREALEGIN